MLREEQSQATEVSVTALGVRLSLVPFFLSSDIVYHVPEMIVGYLVIRMGIDEVVFGQFQNNGDESKELSCDLIPELAVELADFGIVLLDDVVLAHIVPVGDGFGDIELETMTKRPMLRERENAYHFNVFFHTSIADPSGVLSVAEILTLGKIAWVSTLFIKGLLEEGVANAKLTKHFFVVDASVDNSPEAYSGDCIIKLFGEFLLTAWLIKAREVNCGEWCPFKVF